jgi:hypothetical protein
LVPNRHYVVARSFEKLQAAAPDVFVELELHATRPTGTGKMRSRATSAP